MRRRWWFLVAVVAALGCLIGGYLYLSRPKPGPAYETGGKPELSRMDKEKLLKMVLSGRKEGTLIVERKGDGWTLNTPDPVAIDAARLDDLIYDFTALLAERVIDESPTDLGQYGLSPPKAVAEGTSSDGTVKTLSLGDRTPAGNTYYLQVKGDPKVYTVWMNVGEHFHWTAADLRDKTIAPAINAEEITSLVMRQRNGTVVEIKEKTTAEAGDLRLGFGKYLMTRPWKSPRGVKSDTQDAVIRGPSGIAIADFVDDKPGDLSRYGLDRPWGEVRVSDKANTIGFLFGGDMTPEKVYFMIRGRPGLYSVEKSLLAFMDQKPLDMVERFAFIVSIDDVDRIDFTAGGKTHVMTMSRAAKKAETEGQEDEIVTTFTLDGKVVEDSSFRKLYQSLIGVQIAGEAPKASAAAPEIIERFILNKGSEREVRVAFAPYDRDFYTVTLNGKTEFVAERGMLAPVLQKLDILLNGGTIEN